MNLPDIIPIQFGITLIPSNWGSKATIFIFPIVLLLVPTFMSKKNNKFTREINNWENSN
ncbi:DUF1648 domain-containing protein [Lactococcus lactis]|uniref:DUF1648 domain-containing protein n=1 Tax=Lactococcus lactis TaxID=1358 RepID=UPI0021F3C8FB|nr:DUF1648 domain-containing protein [Lactococcus lactis]